MNGKIINRTDESNNLKIKRGKKVNKKQNNYCVHSFEAQAKQKKGSQERAHLAYYFIHQPTSSSASSIANAIPFNIEVQYCALNIIVSRLLLIFPFETIYFALYFLFSCFVQPKLNNNVLESVSLSFHIQSFFGVCLCVSVRARERANTIHNQHQLISERSCLVECAMFFVNNCICKSHSRLLVAVIIQSLYSSLTSVCRSHCFANSFFFFSFLSIAVVLISVCVYVKMCIFSKVK